MSGTHDVLLYIEVLVGLDSKFLGNKICIKYGGTHISDDGSILDTVSGDRGDILSGAHIWRIVAWISMCNAGSHTGVGVKLCIMYGTAVWSDCDSILDTPSGDR